GLARGGAWSLLRSAAVRPDTGVGDGRARPRPRAERRPALAACYLSPHRGKEVVREWRFPVRAVEVPAGRGVSPGPTGNRLASVGDNAFRAAAERSAGRKRLYRKRRW